MDEVKKWYSMSEYVDNETGELISKSLVEREYIIIKKSKKYEINGSNGIIKWLNECERNRQKKLFE